MRTVRRLPHRPAPGHRDIVDVDSRPMLNRLVNLFLSLPRLLRFLVIGTIGLAVDVGLFTIVATFGVNPLVARGISLAIATLVTWRFNRALTFETTGRRQH